MKVIFSLCAWFLALNVSFALALGGENPSELESFDLASLHLAAIYLAGKCGPEALISDSNGYFHRAFVGDWIGKHYGVIKKIETDRVQIMETYRKGSDQWEQKEVWLVLAKPEKKTEK